MIWWRLVLLNLVTPPVASLTLVTLLSLFFGERPSGMLGDGEGLLLASTLHLPGTVLVATPATLLILRKAPSDQTYVLKLAVVGTLGGALLLTMLGNPILGAVAGLNAAIVWAILSIWVVKLPFLARCV